MHVFEVIMLALSGLISLYSTLIFIRIVLTWFPGARFWKGRVYRILTKITDPFLYLFSGVRFFRIGDLDFSPIAAFVLLSIASNIALEISQPGQITAGRIVFLAIFVISHAFSFLLGLFAIITGLRLVAYIINADTYYSLFWRAIDTVSAPIIYRITRLYFPRRVVKYKTSLVISLCTLITALAGLTVLMPVLRRLFNG
jgi:YggT family protein